MRREASLPPQTRKRLKIVYGLWSAVLIVITFAGLLRLAGEVGKPFGGFTWAYAEASPHVFVGVWPWRSWTGYQAGILPVDRILSVDGKPPPANFGQFYEEGLGRTITYVVERDGRRLSISIPVISFTWMMLLESYGLTSLIGFIHLLAGFILLRREREEAFVVVSFTLLGLAMPFLSNSLHGGFRSLYYDLRLTLILYIPSYPLVGSSLLYFSLVFPRRLAVLQRRPAILWWVYLMGLLVGLTYFASLGSSGQRVQLWAIVLYIGYALIGSLATIIRGLYAYVLPPGTMDSSARARVGIMAVAWLIGVVLYSVVGVVPYLLGGPTFLLVEIALPAVGIFPLALVYAVRYTEHIGQRRTTVTIDLPEQVWQKAQSLAKPLTRREMEVLTLYAEGMTDEEIDKNLFIAGSTVRSHGINLRRKLRVKNRTEAVAEARKHGLL